MTPQRTRPDHDVCELTLFGPGYGESLCLHVGDGNWVIVDSCLLDDGIPSPLAYFSLVVATHWHDDHIQGMAEVVKTCHNADFCCSAALCRNEFLSLVDALERNHKSECRSGLKEIHDLVSHVESVGRKPLHVLGTRPLLRRRQCEIHSISPQDATFHRFLRSVRALVPAEGRGKMRVADPDQNETSVALWVEVGACTLLLGADLDSKGWAAVLADRVRPDGKASVFKVPHHGSKSAHEPRVWSETLAHEPVAVLTPWRLADRERDLPTQRDVRRLRRATPNAWITNADPTARKIARRNQLVRSVWREDRVRSRRLVHDQGMVRLRRRIESDGPWSVETFGPAGNLVDYAA